MNIKDFRIITSIDIRGKFYILDDKGKKIESTEYASISIPTSNTKEIKEVITRLNKQLKDT